MHYKVSEENGGVAVEPVLNGKVSCGKYSHVVVDQPLL